MHPPHAHTLKKCTHTRRLYPSPADDHLRLINVPPRNAGDDDRNFRNLDGIVQDEGGEATGAESRGRRASRCAAPH